MRLRLVWTNSYKTKYFATPRSHIFWFLCSREGGRGLLSSWGCRKSNFVVAEQKAKKRTFPHWMIPLQTSHTCALQTYRPDVRVNFWQETWPWKHEKMDFKSQKFRLAKCIPPPPPLRGLYNCDIPSGHSNKSTKSLKPLGCIKFDDMLMRSTANFNCSDIGQSSVNISKYIFRQMFMHGK